MRLSRLLPVLLLALAVRVGLFAFWSLEIVGDSVSYHELALGLARGNGYVDAGGNPTSWRPPGYPFFLAAAYRISGTGAWAVRIPQLLLDLGTVTLVTTLGASVLGSAVGVWSGLLVAVNLGTVAASGRLLSETLFTFLLLLAVTLLRGAFTTGEGRVKTPSTRDLVLTVTAGLALALATLTRGILLVFPAFLAGGVLLVNGRGGHGKGGIRGPVLSGVLLVSFAVGLFPWAWRNYQVHGALVPVTTQVGATLYSSVNPPDGWRFGMLASDSIVDSARGLPEAEASRVLTREAIRSIAQDPVSFARLELLKALFFLVPLDWEVLPWQGAFNPTYAFILLFACLLPLLRKGEQEGRDAGEEISWWEGGGNGLRGGDRSGSRPVLWLVALPIAYLFLLALVFYGSPRMRLPMEPFLAVFAAGALESFHRRWGPRRTLALVVGAMAGLSAVGLGLNGARDILRSLVTGGS